MNARQLLRAWIARREISARTERGYEQVLNVFERWLGRPASAKDIEREADAYCRLRLDGGVLCGETIKGNRHTARAHRAVLAILLRVARRHRLTRRRRLRPIRRRAHTPMAMLPCEFQRFVLSASPVQRAAAFLALDTGYRRSDLFRLRYDQSAPRDDGSWLVWLIAGKTGRREFRRILPRTVAAVLAIRREGSPFMLPRQAPGFTRWRMKWHATGRAAGVDTRRRGLQSIRRTGASILKASGKDPKKYLGHATDGVAEEYYLDERICGDVPDVPDIDRPPPSPPPLG